MMKRQPTADDMKMLSNYEATVKQKNRQMKAMAAELNMYQAQVTLSLFKISFFNFLIRSMNISMRMTG